MDYWSVSTFLVRFGGMKTIFGVLLLSLATITTSFGQDVKVYQTFDEFEEPILKQDNDTTYVINFWATWCVPCVAELPYFEELNAKYSSGKFKQILVSLDFEKQVEKRVKPMISKKGIKSEVVLLADSKQNKWIVRVDPRWSGAIPITIIYKGGEKLFLEKEFHSMAEIETELLKIYKH